MSQTMTESKAMTDVWSWKAEIYEEFKNLSLELMILEITKKAKATAMKAYPKDQTPC